MARAVARAEADMAVRVGDEQWARGCELTDAGDREGAVAAWREALRLNPDHPDARYNLGVALYEGGDVDGALAAWRETVRRDPGFSEAHERLGHAALTRYRERGGRGDLVTARDGYGRAVALRGEDAGLLLALAYAQWEAGERKAAVATAERALRADPARHETYEFLFRWQWRLGRWAAAWRTARAWVERPDYDPAVATVSARRVLVRLALPVALVSVVVLVLRAAGSRRG